MTYNFCDRVLEILHHRGGTTRQLEARTGITRRALCNWRNGKYPSVHLLVQIADELDVSTDHLLGVNFNDQLLQNALDEAKAFGGCNTCSYGVSYDGRPAVCTRQDDGVFPKEDGSCWDWRGWKRAE